MRQRHRRRVVRYAARQAPQVVDIDQPSQASPFGMQESKYPLATERKTPEPRSLEEAIKYLDQLSPTSTAPLPASLFDALDVEDLTKSDVLQLLKGDRLADVPMSTEESNRLENQANQLFCPLTQNLMRDPVKAADKRTYERVDFQLAIANTPHLAQRGFTGVPITNFEVIPDNDIREQTINILKRRGMKLAEKAKAGVVESHILTPPSDPLKRLMWPQNPGSFKNFPNPFARVAISQLRNPSLGISLKDVSVNSGRIVIETKEATLASQNAVTSALKAIFPGEGNDAATYRIPSEAQDRIFGVKFTWETDAIEGKGGQQEDWRKRAEELHLPMIESTPVMTKDFAAQTLLRFLQNVLTPANAFGAEAKQPQDFPSLDQQAALKLPPDLVNIIFNALLDSPESTPLSQPSVANEALLKLLEKFKNSIELVKSQRLQGKSDMPLYRIRLKQPSFDKLLEALGEIDPTLKASITEAQKPRYRTTIRESFVNEATALATGGKRAKANLEFKGVENDEAYFAVKGQLPVVQSEAPTRFVFNFDCSGSMKSPDLEQLELIQELFIEKYTPAILKEAKEPVGYEEDGTPIMDEKVLEVKKADLVKQAAAKVADIRNLGGRPELVQKRVAALNELKALIEERQRKEGDAFPEKYKYITETCKVELDLENPENTPGYPTRMYFAKKAFKSAYEQIKKTPNASLTIMKFGRPEGGEIVKQYEKADLNDEKSVFAAIDSITPDHGQTHFLPGLKAMLATRKQGEEMVAYTLTDGETTEMIQGQTPEQIKNEMTKLIQGAGFTPTIICVGYKFNEIKEPTPEKTKKTQESAEQVIKDFAGVGGQGSEAHTISQSNRLEDVFSSKSKEFVKASACVVSLPLMHTLSAPADGKEATRETKSLELITYPNQYFEKTVRIPLTEFKKPSDTKLGDLEIDIPNFGKQVISTSVKAAEQTVISARTAELERRLFAEGIDPRVQTSFATERGKKTIEEMKASVIKEAQESKEGSTVRMLAEASVNYLQQVVQSGFIPIAAPKFTPITSFDEDKIASDAEVKKAQEAKEAAAKADTLEGVRAAAEREFTATHPAPKRPRYVGRGGAATAEKRQRAEAEFVAKTIAYEVDKTNYVQSKINDWRAKKEGKEQKTVTAVKKTDEEIALRTVGESRDQYLKMLDSCLQQASMTPLPSVTIPAGAGDFKSSGAGDFKSSVGRAVALSESSSGIKAITDQGAIFMFDFDDTIIGAGRDSQNELQNSNNLMIDACGWPSDHKNASAEDKKALEEKLWGVVKDLPAVGVSWEQWGLLFKQLLSLGHKVAIPSLNVYGDIIIPRLMKEKMGLSPEEIKRIAIHSYQIEGKEAEEDPALFGKQPHEFDIVEKLKLPPGLPRILIDDNADNNRLFEKNAHATIGRELDRAILATEDGSHIKAVRELAVRMSPVVVAQESTRIPGAMFQQPKFEMKINAELKINIELLSKSLEEKVNNAERALLAHPILSKRPDVIKRIETNKQQLSEVQGILKTISETGNPATGGDAKKIESLLRTFNESPPFLSKLIEGGGGPKP